MVNSGGHALQIVDAITKKPLREFRASDGTVWVEGQDGNEFFLRVKGPAGIRTIAENIMVDGIEFGYAVYHGPFSNLSDVLGIVDGHGNEVALKFARLQTTNDAGKDGERCGKASVTWYDAEIKERERTTASAPTFPSTAFFGKPQEDSIGFDASVFVPEDKKTSVGALKAVVGSQALRSAPLAPTAFVSAVVSPSESNTTSQKETYWQRRRRRTTLTIHYCEAAGLIARKIATAADFGIAATPAPRASTGPKERSTDGKKKTVKKEKKIETIDLTDENAAPIAGAIGYEGQVRALKKRVRDGSLTIDEYQTKKALLDDIYGDD